MKIFAWILPLFLPVVVRWANARQDEILAEGEELNEEELEAALKMGVTHPERVRLLRVKEVPLPNSPILGRLSKMTGFASPGIMGMSLGYGIYIRQDCWRDLQLVAHECVHTAQFERLGGMRGFLGQYLKECFIHGYPAAPLEREAAYKSSDLFL